VTLFQAIGSGVWGFAAGYFLREAIVALRSREWEGAAFLVIVALFALFMSYRIALQ